MKRILVCLVVFALALGGVWAVATVTSPAEFDVSLTINESSITPAFEVKLYEGVLDDVSKFSENIELSGNQSFDKDVSSNAHSFDFTVGWRMVTATTNAPYTISMKATTLAAAGVNDPLTMTVKRNGSQFASSDTAITYNTSDVDSITPGSSDSSTIISFNNVNSLETNGGVAFTLGVTDEEFGEAQLSSTGTTYKTTITITVSNGNG